MTQAQMDPATALAELEETKSDKVTIVLLSGDMDRAMAAFIIATGAAAMGMQVTMFFTFWGLNAIRKTGVRNSPKDWLRRMFGILNKGGAERLPLSRFHFGGLGTRMMKRVMGKSRMPGVPELIENGETGVLVPPRSPEKICEALKQLSTSENWTRYSKRARSRFERAYGEDVVKALWLNSIEEITFPT